MPVWVGEKRQSRKMKVSGGNMTVSRELRITGDPSETELDVYALVLAEYPPTYGPLVLSDIEIQEVKPGEWSVVVTYGSATSPARPPGDPPVTPPDATEGFRLLAREWDHGTTTVHRTHSRETVKWVNEQGVQNPPGPHNRAVNVSNGEPQGYDVIVPDLAMVESWQIPTAMWTPTYARTVAGIIGTVNNNTWRTYEAGELLLTGVHASYRGGGYMEAQYRFAISLNEPAFKPVPELAATDKKGWDYAWIEAHVGISTSPGNKEMVSLAKRVHIEKVYVSTNYVQLGLGS